MKLEAKVGMFVVAGVSFLFLMSTQVNKFNMSDKDGYEIYGYMSNISGLEKFSKVKINGLEVGHIKEFALKGNKVRVTFIIEDGINIDKNATLAKAQDNFLGGKFVDIIQGESSEYIGKYDSIVNEKNYPSFEETSKNVAEAAEEFKLAMIEIRSLVSDNRKNIDSILYEFKHMTISINDAAKKLNDILSQNEAKIASTINNVDSFFAEGSSLIKENKMPLKSAIKSADGFFYEGKGTIRKIDKYLSSILDSELKLYMKDEYLLSDKSQKIGLGLVYKTNPTRFYSFDIVSMDDYSLDSSGNVKVPKKHENGKYLFSAQFGKRYSGTSFRAGIIESTGGGGIDQMFLKDRLKISADVYDFNAVNDARGENPHARASIRYTMLKHLDLYLGYDNFLNSEASNVYFGVGFSAVDNDLKSILGTGAAFVK
jgi:phospholipid/cholesterol/gamma-HCH transport system substrate-binding protein